ncbi:hypothetical protein [Baileyella intestinalis]|uniref:hypothetical protein n=1 Tax=Baileyella intestinalis TaxID=2606709 RepID=UPI003A86919B
MYGNVNGGGNVKPMQIAVSGGHKLNVAGNTARTYTWSKADLGVPANGQIKDVIFNMENTDDIRSGFWTSFSITEDSVKVRMYNAQSVGADCEFRLSILYTA